MQEMIMRDKSIQLYQQVEHCIENIPLRSDEDPAQS